MAEISRTVVSLRICGDDLDPEEITRLLGAAPTNGRRKGELRRTPRGGEIVARTGSWTLKAEERSPGDLSSQITEVLSRLTVDLTIWTGLRRRYNCDLFCGLFMERRNEGEELSPEAMTMVAERGLSLGLDIYGPDKRPMSLVGSRTSDAGE